MRRQDYVRQPFEHAHESRPALRLFGKDVDGRARDLARFQAGGQRFVVDDKTAAQVEEARALLHRSKLFCAKKIAVLRLTVDVQADHVGSLKQLTKSNRAGVAPSQYVRDIVEDNAHAHSLREIGKLRTDLPVADNAEREATHLVSARGGFVPDSSVHFSRRLKGATQQRDDLSDGQLSHGARIRVRIVEHSDAALVGSGAVNLVHADAEGTHRNQVRSGLHHRPRDWRLRAHAEDCGVANSGDQVTLIPCRLVALDVVSGGAELFHGYRADIFQQQNLQEASWW